MARPKGKKTRRKHKVDAETEERQAEAKKLQERYGKKTNESEVTTVYMRKSDGVIVNPSKPTIQRFIQNYLNKLNVPEEPEKLLPRKWVCCFCGLQSCSDSLGDLYGPYYIASSVAFPDFLPKASKKSPSGKAKNSPNVEQGESDIWFHGSCALWTPNLMFFGGKFPRLAEVLQTSWHQKCRICKKPGASIPIDKQTGHVHYPCAIGKNYRMEELTLRCLLPKANSAY